MPFTVSVGPYQGGSYLAAGLSRLGEGFGMALARIGEENQKVNEFQAQLAMLGSTADQDGKPYLDPKALARVQGFTRAQQAAVGGKLLGMQHAMQLIQQTTQEMQQRSEMFPLQKQKAQADVDMIPTEKRKAEAEAGLAEERELQATQAGQLPYLKIGNTFYNKQTGEPMPTAGQMGVAERNKAKIMQTDIKDLDDRFYQSRVDPNNVLDPDSVQYLKLQKQPNGATSEVTVKDPSQATHVRVKGYELQPAMKDAKTGKVTPEQFIESPRTLTTKDYGRIKGDAERLQALRAIHSGYTSDPTENAFREAAVMQIQKLGIPLTEGNIQKGMSLLKSKSGGKAPKSAVGQMYYGAGGSAPSGSPVPGGDNEAAESASTETEEDEGSDSDL